MIGLACRLWCGRHDGVNRSDADLRRAAPLFPLTTKASRMTAAFYQRAALIDTRRQGTVNPPTAHAQGREWQDRGDTDRTLRYGERCAELWIVVASTLPQGWSTWGQGLRSRETHIGSFGPRLAAAAGGVTTIGARAMTHTPPFDSPEVLSLSPVAHRRGRAGQRRAHGRPDAKGREKAAR